MSILRTVTRVCERDMYGKCGPALHLDVEFTIDGQRYRGDLCEVHWTMMRRDFGPWRTAFVPVDEPAEVVQLNSKRQTITSDQVDRDRRAADLRAAEAARNQAEVDAKTHALQAEAMEIQRLKRTIPGARSWVISAHARKRMALRNFGPDEVLHTVASPQINYPAPERYGPGRYVYVRGDCRAVVDPRGKTVITVIDRNDHWDARPTAERIAQ